MIITYFLNLKHEIKSCCCAAFISAQQQLIFYPTPAHLDITNTIVKIFYILFLYGVCAYRRNIRIIASYTFVYG